MMQRAVGADHVSRDARCEGLFQTPFFEFQHNALFIRRERRQRLIRSLPFSPLAFFCAGFGRKHCMTVSFFPAILLSQKLFEFVVDAEGEVGVAGGVSELVGRERTPPPI